MKKKLLLLSLIVLCLGCLLAVGVSATESTTPALDLTYTNLSFSDSVYLKYAVSAENVTEDDVRLLVWTEPQSDYTSTANATILMPLYLENIEGEDYIIFNYTALAAKQMTDVVYARATVEANGTTYYSAVRKYSILRYAYTVKNDPASEATLVTMLTDMLNYGASAQKHFNYKANRPANGAWYDIQVVNGTLSDGFTYGLYMDQDEIVLTADPAPDGMVFSHWKDASGANVSDEATYTTIISYANTYTAVYKEEGAGDEVILNKLAYTINADGRTCTITGMGTCTGPIINIPAEIDGYTVTGIGEKAFAEQTTLTAINIPDTVKTIATRAFYGCTGLTELTIPASVTSIGNQIVYKCNSLETVYYNSTYTPSSSGAAFLNLSSIKTVVFGGTKVPDYVLYNCTGVQNVVIPQGTQYIGSAAFYGCTSLTSITIPDGVTNIGSNTFYGCTSLASVTFGENSRLTSIGYGAFENCTSLASITIPDSVTSIGDWAFSGCTSLTSITIPDSVTSIGSLAFASCKSLTSITIPDGVTSIGLEAFYGCTSLTSISIPDSVTSIGDSAFRGCTSLTSITIPDSVTYIDGYAFWDCTSLASVTFGEDSQLISIGYGAFENCTSLTSITIPDSVTSIGSAAFSGCTSLNTVYYGGTVEDWISITIGIGNSDLTNATRYYYSEAQPTAEGNYWHYVDDVPALW